MKQKPEKKFRLSTNARIMRGGAEGDAARERAREDRYDFYDSPLESFDTHFSEVLAPFGTIGDYMESHYGGKHGEAVGVEFGGPARKLFGQLNKDALFRKTAGFVLNDLRTDDERHEDESRHHDVVEADVFFKNGAEGLSWHGVEEWTERNGKPDIIVERMVQGVDLIRRADLFVAIVKRWLSQLSSGGTLLAEIPHAMRRPEREKIVTLMHDDEIEAEDIAFGSELTSLLVRLRA